MPHGGCDPPARMRGLIHSCGIGGPEAEADLRAEGKRSGSAEIRPHTPIVTYATLVFPLARGIFNFFYETMKDL